MTYLQKLIDQGVSRGFMAQLDVAMEKAGIEFAKELMADPEFRKSLRALVRAQTERLLQDLNTAIPEE